MSQTLGRLGVAELLAMSGAGPVSRPSQQDEGHTVGKADWPGDTEGSRKSSPGPGV
jgi:hypothetical protein